MSDKVKDYGRLPRYFYLLCALAAFSALLYLIAALNPTFAEWFNGTVSAALRWLLAHMTSFLPFSLAEVFLLTSPVLIVLVGIYAYRYRCDTWHEALVFIACLLSVASILFSLFVFCFGTGYHTRTLDERMELQAGEVTVSDLEQTARLLAQKVNTAAEDVSFGEDGFSVMPYGTDEMNDILLDAYKTTCSEYSFIQQLDSRVKPVMMSRLMSYTHITGIYTFFTGEANINIAFPDYTTPFTAAHELAHQRGIARENEANFVAFLVTSRSDDAYVRYSAYLNLFEYVASALIGADAEAGQAVLDLLCDQVKGELRAYAAFFETYRDSAAADISEAVNDTFLKANGNEAGTASYGLVVELAVAYYRDGIKP